MALKDYIYNKPVIETDRLVIRPMNVTDIPALKKWMPDRSIYTYWGKGPGKAEKDPELLFERKERPAKSFHLGIAEKETDEVIGDLWVYPKRRGPRPNNGSGVGECAGSCLSLS
ncbi:MAG: GNAT family N-acetyltransferase [Eubacteriales bacterium]|nr:GNAT family N-acetyltransferase [Eubacteriales bacterium]